MNLTLTFIQAIPKSQIDLLIDIYRPTKDQRRFMLLLDVLNIGTMDGKPGTHKITDEIANEVLDKFGPIIKRVKVNAD